MERALRLIEAPDVPSEGIERRTAARGMRTAPGSHAKARDHGGVEAKGRDPIADALLCIGNDGPNLHAPVLKCSSAVLRDALEVIADRGGFALRGHAATWYRQSNVSCFGSFVGKLMGPSTAVGRSRCEHRTACRHPNQHQAMLYIASAARKATF